MPTQNQISKKKKLEENAAKLYDEENKKTKKNFYMKMLQINFFFSKNSDL